MTGGGHWAAPFPAGLRGGTGGSRGGSVFRVFIPDVRGTTSVWPVTGRADRL